MTPERQLIGNVEWTYFCTLTFEFVPPLSRQRSAALAFVRRLGLASKCSPKALTWALRFESGERGAREHLHMLVRVPNTARLSDPGFVARIWSRQLAFGISNVRYFNPSLGGVDYVLKGIGSYAGGNQYEMQKYVGTQVMLSTRWDTSRDLRQKPKLPPEILAPY